MRLTFEHPAWLLLLILAIPVAWSGLRWFSSMSRARRWSAVILRVLLIALITAMLAGASAVRRTDRLAVIPVIDVSGSTRLFGRAGQDESGQPLAPLEAARRFLAAAESARGPDDLLGAVVFDGRSLAVAVPTRAAIADRAIDLRLADGTNIAAALRYAAALIPPDAAGRLVLISDGNQTAGDALAAARELAGRSAIRGPVPIDVAPIALDASNEVMIEAVDAPPRAPVQATITVRVTLLATAPAAGTLTLLHSSGAGPAEPLDINGPEPGVSRRLELDPGRTVERLRVELPPGHTHQFRAVFEPDRVETPQGIAVAGDTRAENNAGEAFTYSPGKGSVLLVDGVNAGAGTTLGRVLRDAGIEVTTLAPEGLPDTLLALQGYDLIILENVPADAVGEEAQRALADHVRQMGAGLVMVGGPDSFGAGGWKGSVIEPLLPVRLDLPERLVQPDAAVVFVLDNSGSMGRSVLGSEYTQQEIANQSAAQAIKSLASTDLISVIVFNTTTDVLVPLRPNTDPNATAERILSISPGGGTVLGPALQEAHNQLKDVRAAVKHVIVLSDGRSADPASLPAIASRMKADGITISTISVGDQTDERNMAEIADRGGGRFYAVSNPTLLPRFFLKAVKIVRTPLLRNEPFNPVLLPAPSPLTAGLGNPPALGGLVLTQRRPEPTITYAMQTPAGEPLLAHWTVELGQVAAFTSDANPAGWARDWIDWPGYRQMWTQAARTLARPSTTDRMDLSAEVAGDTLRLRLDAMSEDGNPLDLLTVPATVRTPSGEQIRVTLSQTGPGMYEGSAPAAEGGNYIAIVTPSLAGRRLPPVIGGASVAFGVEFRALETNTALLESIARETGGRILNLSPAAAAGLFDRTNLPPTLARTPLWRPLLLWTLVVLLLDVATRRIAWDRFVSREFGAGLRERAEQAVRDRSAEAQRAVERLREAPRRVAPPAPSPVTLSAEDAERLREAAVLRRQRERLARLQAARAARRETEAATQPEAPAPAEPEPTPRPRPRPAPRTEPAPERPAEPGDLRAAKRRARERFGDLDSES